MADNKCKYLKVCKDKDESCENGLRDQDQCILTKYHSKIRVLFFILKELLEAVKYNKRISNEHIKELENKMKGDGENE